MSVVLACIWFFILGTAMGSFFNVLIDRLPEGRDIVSTRSSCENCGTKLKWIDLIPVFSFVFLRGKCRYCGAKLSPWYLISELIVGTLYAFSFLLYSFDGNAIRLFSHLVIWSLLFIVAVMDQKTGMIMDLFSILIAVFSIGFGLLEKRPILEILLGGAVGAAFFGILYLGARLILKKEGMGLGDVILLGAIGFGLPWVQVIVTGFLTAYVAILFIVIRAIAGRSVGMKTEIPLGPSICISAFIMTICGSSIVGFLSHLLFR